MIHFRRTVPEDAMMVANWIAQDKGHAGMEADFFLETKPGISCFAVETEQGPLMFVRQESEGETTRLHIQFAPYDRKRIVQALREGYPLLVRDAIGRGFRRISFDSQSPALIRVMLELGFRAELIHELQEGGNVRT